MKPPKETASDLAKASELVGVILTAPVMVKGDRERAIEVCTKKLARLFADQRHETIRCALVVVERELKVKRR